MHKYLIKMMSYYDILASVGHRVSDQDNILYILSGLGTECDPVVVGALLLSFETRLDRSVSVNTEGSALAANLFFQNGPRRENSSSFNSSGSHQRPHYTPNPRRGRGGINHGGINSNGGG